MNIDALIGIVLGIMVGINFGIWISGIVVR
jgi:hypothetical protein